MKSSIRKTSILLFIFSILIMSSVITSALPARILTGDIYDVSIDDAYYIDYDVVVILTAIVSTSFTHENYYIQVTITNPVGEQHTVTLRVFTSLETVTLEITFYNCATEPGDYIVDAALLNKNSGYWYIVTDNMVFDPPGGSGGDPVSIGIKII